jgi:Protein of unknown function (DUF3455)
MKLVEILVSSLAKFYPLNWLNNSENCVRTPTWLITISLGGNSPKDCNRSRQNTEIAVPYTADYYFYSDPKRP